jgi:hypothetical protein
MNIVSISIAYMLPLILIPVLVLFLLTGEDTVSFGRRTRLCGIHTGGASPACLEMMMLSTRRTETAAPVLKIIQSQKGVVHRDNFTYANFKAQSFAANESSIEALVVATTPLFSP